MKHHFANINPNKGLLWRFVHLDHLEHVLRHGLDARDKDVCYMSSFCNDNVYKMRAVSFCNGMKLNDYLSFYLNPLHPQSELLFYKIPKNSLCILVYNIFDFDSLKIKYLISERSPAFFLANYYFDSTSLPLLEWNKLSRKFEATDELNSFEIEYLQSEVLVLERVPPTLINGIVTFDQQANDVATNIISNVGMSLDAHVKPQLFLRGGR
ncbi:DarT ssDNA thymidine ADP-ribosyltransferase family protein [Aeromonas dhakensis]|uniref:DarT ssDNA thymidine ADP-ribosyltransferase family protein n=1 Tax=Aeromonas dhakensis TaxID=196024 RepID=UPI0038D05A69